jgi:AcrR family transcriptional regulator
MSPRPRKVTDDQIFEALVRAMQRVPATELTLAEVGAEAGVTASAVVQRFGSKQALLRALNARFADGMSDLLRGIRERHASPLAAIRGYAEGFAWMVTSPAAMAHHLGYLQMDLSDAVMFKHVRRATRASRETLAQWVDEAIGAGEIRAGTDATALARLIHTTVNGSMMSYAILQAGKPAAWLRDDIELALGPYLATRR